MAHYFYQLAGPRDLKKVEAAFSSCSEGEVFAETVYSVVSTGTELAAWEGQPPLRPSKIYPRLLGYCNLAQVKEIGSGSKFRPGDYILTHQSHRSAFKCTDPQIILRIDEASGEHLKAQACTYLYHLGYSALLSGGFRPGHQVNIIGMGTLGLTTASLAAAFGSEPVVFSSRPDLKTCLSRLNFKRILTKNETAVPYYQDRFGMDGADITICTSNEWPDHLLAMKETRKGGTIVHLGFPGRDGQHPAFNPLDSQFFYDKQLSIKHCGHVDESQAPAIDSRFTLHRNMAFLSGLIADKRLRPSEIISFEAAAHELAEVYENLSERSSCTFTALLRWHN